MRGNERVHRFTLLSLALCPLLLAPRFSNAGISIVSDSLLRIMEGRVNGGDLLLPGYEHVRADLGTLDADGFSFHGYGWGRFNFGETGGRREDGLEDRSDGELLYGYLEYYRSSYNAFARLGRQNVFSGASNLAIDGVRIGSDLTPYFAVETWGGYPVALEVVRGRSGDHAWGGRVEHHYKSLYALGLSYKAIQDDNDQQVEVVAVDSSIRPPAPVSITGYSARNLRTDSWAEHSYDGRILLKQFRVGLVYRYYDFEDFLDRGVFNAGVLSLQRKPRDLLNEWGGDVVTNVREPLEVGVRYLRTARSGSEGREGGLGHRVTGLATLHGTKLDQLGVELGRQFGDNERATFWLSRGYFYVQRDPGFFSGEVVYARYHERIRGEPSSFFAALGTGRRFLDDALELRLSGDFSDDPFFDSDFRGILAATYKFGR